MSLFDKIINKSEKNNPINTNNKNGLFSIISKQAEKSEKYTPQNIMLKELNYENLLDPEKVDKKFVSLFEEVMLQASERGHFISVDPENKKFKYEHQPSNFSIYRHNPKHINKLIDYIQIEHNTKCVFESEINLNPPLPEIKDFNINTDAERNEKTTLHVTYDVETNQHQKLYNEKYQDIEISGGVLGAYFAEAKRYIEFKHTRFKKEKKLKLFKDQNNNTVIFMKGTDPLEALMIVMIEVEIAAILLSAIAQNQHDLISIFQECMENLPIPVNTEILENLLYHKHFISLIAHNAGFDLNRVIETRKKHKHKKFNYFLPICEPKTITLQYGNNSETLESKTRTFSVKMGNIPAGLRYKVKHNTKWSRGGKPEIFIAPYQKGAQYLTFGLDTLELAKAAQVPAGKRGLKELSKSTKFPALDDSEMTLKEKLFVQSDFYINDDKTLSKASHYLYRDCLATLSTYGELTNMLSMKDLEEVTNNPMTNTYFNHFPLLHYINSTATLSKEFVFADISKITGLSAKEIELNFAEQRKYFPQWNIVLENFYDSITNDPMIKEHPIFQAARITTWIYGQIRRKKPYEICLLDFKSQYPHMARQACSMDMIYLAAQNKLHTKLNNDIDKLQERFWFAINKILKNIHSEGTIPDKTLIYLNGVVKVHLKDFFQIRDNVKTICYPKLKKFKRPKIIKKCDKLVKGHKILYLSELAHAVIRIYELKGLKNKNSQWHTLTHEEKLKWIKKKITFIEGQFLEFESKDVKDHGKELFTEIYNLRKTYQDLANRLSKIIKSPTNKQQKLIDEFKETVKLYNIIDKSNLSLEEKYFYYSIVQRKLKWLMNALFGTTAEGINKNFVGKLLCPPIPSTITAFAKFENNLAEIYLRKYKGLPLYSHTDSLACYAHPKTIKKVQNLFSEIDPLETEDKPEYQEIDWFLGIGKGKYAFHSKKAQEINQQLKRLLDEKKITKEEYNKQKVNEFTFTCAGSGSYGEFLVSPAYEKMAKALYDGKSIDQAIKEAKNDFPLTYQLTYRETRLSDPSTVKTLNKLCKTEPIEILNFNNKLSIYIYSSKNITDEKDKTKSKTWRKLISTTNNIFYNNFGDYHNFKIQKINKKEAKERKRLQQQFRKLAKKDPQTWRGWTKLKSIKDMQQALFLGRLPDYARPKFKTSDFHISPEAKELAESHPKLNALTAQHLLNLIEELVEDIELEDLTTLDKTLSYSELKTLILQKYGKSEDELSYQDMNEDELFKELKESIEIDYEAKLISKQQYKESLKELYKQFDKKPKIKTKKYVNPFPEGANNVIFYNSSPIPFNSILEFVLNNSKTLTDWERKSIIKNLEERPKAITHLKKRYNFNPNFYMLYPDRKTQKMINKELKLRYKTKTKRKQMKNAIISKLIFEEKKLDYIELFPKKEINDGNSAKSIPDPNNYDDDYTSDGFSWNGSCKAPNLNFSEYSVGNKNRAVTQCLLNTSRTLSCEYAKTHSKSEKEMKAKIHDYLFKYKPENLPCPKKSSIRSENMRGFTVRTKFKAVPILKNLEENSITDLKDFKITFSDYYHQWLENGIIENVKDIYCLIKDPIPVNTVMQEILKHEYWNFDFLGKKWTLELKDFNSGEANGMFYIGGVVGKNLTLNYSMRFNPATSKLINFNLFKVSKEELQASSHIVKDLMLKIIKTNTLTSFTRNASLTIRDYKEKSRPTDLLDKVYLCIAQVMLEESIKHSVTKLKQYHITEDIHCKSPEIAKWTIRILNYAIEDVYQELTSKTPTVKQEINYRKKLAIGQSKQGNASAIQNFFNSRAHISYRKGYNQLINKMLRTFMDSNTPENIVNGLRDSVKYFSNIIRIETQLKSYKAINDPQSYKNHNIWKEIVLLAINLVTKQFQKPKHLNIFLQIESIAKELKPLARQFLTKQTIEIYGTPPFIT